MLVHIATAGQAVVGWFSAPPSALGEPTLASWPSRELGSAGRAGCFVVDPSRRDDDGSWAMYWTCGPPDATNNSDPHVLLDELVTPGETGLSSRYGRFAVVSEDAVSLRFDPRARDPDRFVQYRRSTRPATAHMLRLEEPARSLHLVEHVQPLPPTWVAGTVERVCGPGAVAILQEWYDASQGPGRTAARVRVSNRLKISLPVPNRDLPAPHRVALLARLRAEIGSRQVKVGNEERYLRDWYAGVAAEEAQALNGKTDAPSLRPFAALGIAPQPDKGFAYVLQHLAAKREFSAVVKGGLAGFSLRVRKVPVEFLLDAAGARIVDSDGVPKLKHPAVLSDPKAGTALYTGEGDLLIGFFADVGVGLGMGLDSGLSSAEGGPQAKRKDVGGGLLAQVTCYSDADLDAEAFSGLTFTIAALRGPQAAVGAFTSLDAASTTFHQYRLRGGRTLEAVVTNKWKFSPPKLPTFDLLFGGPDGVRKYVESWTKGTASARLFDISVGTGFALRLRTGSYPTIDPSPDRFRPSYDLQGGQGRGVVLFARDSAALRQRGDLLQDARYQLEVGLATMRALITTRRGARIYVDGYTSPEAPRCYNDELSAARAAVVGRAVLDAFPGAGLLTVESGRGERPALADPQQPRLVDPPEDAAGLAKFEADHRDQVARWPSWRKVEVVVDGAVLVLGRTAEATRGTP